ncbi:ribonuclease 3 [Alphaproteobacteria bacterium]|nr:ribonuclease 3 [Alphaproteobacteria bacterium]
MTDHLTGAARAIAEGFGHFFANPALLREALTHRATGENYERLEFLGDRVLGLVVADMLLAAFPHEAEGALARRFSALVCEGTLAHVAETMGLAALIILPEHCDDDRANPALNADIMEAVIGAAFLDGGFEAVSSHVRRIWTPLMNQSVTPPVDPKTALQEWAQARALPLPIYTVVKQEGPPHAPQFTVSVGVAGHGLAIGAGSSKRVAQREAAKAMLTALGEPSA